MQPQQTILGSQSPRRREIFSYFSLPFEAVTPDFDEDSVHFDNNPEEYVCALSQGKADSLYPRFPYATIITADTIVYREGKIFGKPRDRQEALETFMSLAGNWHTVYTGVTVRQREKVFSRAEATRVLFNPMLPKQIDNYLDKVEWADKAGGYAIQKAGGLIVRRIEGCYYNVMGLPINTVEKLLLHVGVELWDYL
ncbi:MAG: septum formation protein Maf [Parachlamydiaceae bacterium]|nr:septum formation protein Maf [Parachlamydiaceae bacterium]